MPRAAVMRRARGSGREQIGDDSLTAWDYRFESKAKGCGKEARANPFYP